MRNRQCVSEEQKQMAQIWFIFGFPILDPSFDWVRISFGRKFVLSISIRSRIPHPRPFRYSHNRHSLLLNDHAVQVLESPCRRHR